MEGLNAEQVIKASEKWVNNFDGKVTDFKTLCEALALIKELTEENKRLQSHINRLKKYDEERDIALHARLIREAKTDTVQKMHSEIKERCIKAGIYPAFVASTIDQIAKEIKEGV